MDAISDSYCSKTYLHLKYLINQMPYLDMLMGVLGIYKHFVLRKLWLTATFFNILDPSIQELVVNGLLTSQRQGSLSASGSSSRIIVNFWIIVNLGSLSTSGSSSRSLSTSGSSSNSPESSLTSWSSSSSKKSSTYS